MSSNDDIRTMFFEECDDLMEALFEGLALLERGEEENDTVNAIFRSVHSIKGGAGAFNLDELVSFSHKFETVLDELRTKRISSDETLMEVMFRAADHLTHLIETSQNGGEFNQDSGSELLNELDNYITKDAEIDDSFQFQPLTLDLNGTLDIEEGTTRLEIKFQPYEKLYKNGHDPLLLISSLGKRGELNVEIDCASLNSISKFDTENPTLKFMLSFIGVNPEIIVEEIFEFVDGICDLEIFESKIENDISSENIKNLETGQNQCSVDDTPVVAPLGYPELIEEPVQKKKQESTTPQPTLRVELNKVDRLINIVGELIINQAMVSQRIDQLELPGDSELDSDMNDYKILARDLQEGVMSIRAQPVKTLFQRMARITREAASATGKSVKIHTIGENTEVDKTVIEKLADPLTHMIRNAVDHGLEDKNIRLEHGKSVTGEIILSASHSSGNVLIELSDDGNGLDRDRIFKIAVEKNLISKDIDLPESEIDKLLFLPGFSTNEEVSELSGRGVGMDVVKRGVEALGGRISISSYPGKGTKFSIVLPLTLAVMDGIVISVDKEIMIVPITAVIETLRPKQTEIFQIGSDQQVLMIRGEYVPIISVRQKLRLSQETSEDDEQVLVLIEGSDQKRCALKVDSIHDQRQVVIKSVGGNYGQIPGVSAATIMGNGQIALILDTEHLSNVRDVNLGVDMTLKTGVKHSL